MGYRKGALGMNELNENSANPNISQVCSTNVSLLSATNCEYCLFCFKYAISFTLLQLSGTKK